MPIVASWSIKGKKVQLKTTLGRTVALVEGEQVAKGIKNKGEFTLPFDGESLLLQRKAAFTGVQSNLLRNGVAVPQSKVVVPRQAAAVGAPCASHPDQAAAIVCAGCGAFTCAACESADGARCQACFSKVAAKAEADRKALAYLTPAFVFVPLFGVLGALLGFAAGGLAFLVGKSDAPRPVKLGVAIALYAIAAGVTVFLAAMIHGATR